MRWKGSISNDGLTVPQQSRLSKSCWECGNNVRRRRTARAKRAMADRLDSATLASTRRSGRAGSAAPGTASSTMRALLPRTYVSPRGAFACDGQVLTGSCPAVRLYVSATGQNAMCGEVCDADETGFSGCVSRGRGLGRL